MEYIQFHYIIKIWYAIIKENPKVTDPKVVATDLLINYMFIKISGFNKELLFVHVITSSLVSDFIVFLCMVGKWDKNNSTIVVVDDLVDIFLSRPVPCYRKRRVKYGLFCIKAQSVSAGFTIVLKHRAPLARGEGPIFLQKNIFYDGFLLMWCKFNILTIPKFPEHVCLTACVGLHDPSMRPHNLTSTRPHLS